MGRTRRSGAELPHAPLELLHPLALPAAEPAALDALTEVPAEHRPTLFKLLRAVLAWSRDPARAAETLDAGALGRLEGELLACGPGPLASPLALLAGYLGHGRDAEPRQVAWACVCVADWAIERQARKTALLFTQAAALAWPRHARYAWLAARLLRAYGHPRESEAWYRRAYRVAAWTDDSEVQG